MALGVASLVASFMEHGLLVEIHLYTIILSGGKTMFPSGREHNLHFIENRTFPDGVVMLKYKIKPAKS